MRRNARGHRVSARINWLQKYRGKSEKEACSLVCGKEFPNICGECDPNSCKSGPTPTPPTPTPPTPTPPTGGSGNCGCGNKCNSSVLNRNANGFKVGSRISWVQRNMGKSEKEACSMVCGREFPNICSAECDPNSCGSGPTPTPPTPTPPTRPTGTKKRASTTRYWDCK